MKISTVNVNGIRAAARKGFLEWLETTDADIVCLQEVRATEDQLPPEIRASSTWQTFLEPAAAKGRAGVAILTRIPPISPPRISFGTFDTFDASGRYLELDLPDGLTVGCLYLPSGETDTPRQVEKEAFMDEFLPYLMAARKRIEGEGHSLVVCGDWNIAHQEADLKNWRNNKKTAGFLPQERAWLSRVFDDAGYIDVVRALHPNVEGPYTFWSMRGRAFDNDTGWRVDYQIATPELASRARSAYVERYESHDARWSDHAPVTVVYDV